MSVGQAMNDLCKPATDRTWEDIMWDEFSILMAVGGSYSFTHTRPWKIFTVVNATLMCSTMTTVMLMLAYTCYLTKDNLSLFSQTSHMLIIGAVVITATSVLKMKRPALRHFRNFFDNPQGLAPYSKTPFFEEQIKKTDRKKNKTIFAWIFSYGTCGVIGLAQPTINSAFGGLEDVPKVDGVWTNLPFALWFPYYDLEKDDTAWLAVYMLENMFLLYAVAMVLSSIIMCFFCMDRQLDQLKLDIYSVKSINLRAKEMFQEKYPGCRKKLMKREYNDCFYTCVVQNADHYLKIKKIFEVYIDIASIPIAVPFYGGAILLGMALITISSDDDPRPGPKVFAAALALTEAANMLMLCIAGQEFQDLSEELFESLYFTPWYNRSTKCTKALILVRHGCSKPIKIMAAGMLNLNMELFGDLVQSAYSIFNLKAASGGN